MEARSTKKRKLEVPLEIKNSVPNVRISESILLAELTSSEIAARKNDEYFLIPIQEVNGHGILTEAQRQVLEQKDGSVQAILIGPLLEVQNITISKHDSTNYALSGWSNLLQPHAVVLTPEESTGLQLLSFKRFFQLGIIMLLKNDDQKIRDQTQAQELLPQEIKNRIKSFGGTEPVFVVEKQLVRSDLKRFSITSKNRVGRFLEEIEEQPFRMPYNTARLDVVLIGTSWSDDKEFRVDLRNRRTMYYLEGPNWSTFVGENKLEVGREVRLWTFRRPPNEVDASFDVGNYIVEPGFACVLKDLNIGV